MPADSSAAARLSPGHAFTSTPSNDTMNGLPARLTPGVATRMPLPDVACAVDVERRARQLRCRAACQEGDDPPDLPGGHPLAGGKRRRNLRLAALRCGELLRQAGADDTGRHDVGLNVVACVSAGD